MAEFTREMVREWCKATTGEFHYKKILDGRINVKASPKAYDKLRADVNALCKELVIEPVKGKWDGMYRLIQELPTPVDWSPINSKQDSGVILPFDLRKYVWIDPGTSIAVAGSKDSGKTGFLMRTIALNMNIMDTIFLTNMEGGRNQVKRRFEAMGIDMNNPPFATHEIMDNYHDAIKPHPILDGEGKPTGKYYPTLYVIDYIDVPESGEFYMIAPALAKIQTPLQYNCVAVIGLQKKKNSDLAYGGEQTLKKVTLYLAMNPGRLKIVSAKIPANPTVFPVNKQWKFTYSEEGTAFTDIEPYYGGDS